MARGYSSRGYIAPETEVVVTETTTIPPDDVPLNSELDGPEEVWL